MLERIEGFYIKGGGSPQLSESIFEFFKGKSSSIVAQNDEMSLKKSILTASLSAY